ncbi:MarR family winged helix-turn-helix transcriptional regulator [Kangiella sp. TOML190]|uniref:MarR family winged helix-turn-helix transcriptional regulator n=1 Tax=Kangiella sp. TOML190 TaxID=2931351 RepID=UPI00203FB59B|nr:MarR family winged helix-turn-helix transcriptional regulator [Kangiella sp. TOML190]
MNNAFEPNEQIESNRAKVIAGIERLSTIFRTVLQAQVGLSGLSALQIQMITLIGFQAKGLCTTTLLANELAVTKGTVSDSLRVLIGKKLVSKVQNKQDSRSYAINLTAAGRKTLAQLNHVTETFNAALKPLSDQQVDELWRNLSQLLSSLQAIGEIPSRMCYSCQFFEPLANGQEFRCQLLKKSMKMELLRLDCPEHKAA